MVGAIVKPNTTDKLKILSADAQYDLACACNTKGEQARTRGDQGNWIYPVSLPNGGQSILFKTLMSKDIGKVGVRLKKAEKYLRF